MRTAKNKEEMLAAIKRESGLVVDILSPAMESLFGAMGARSGFNHVDGLFMDLGGGSVQMTYVDSSAGPGYEVLAAEAAKSLPFGAAKLSAALSSKSTAESAKAELQLGMKETFEGMKARFPKLKAQSEQGIDIYFCGGGFRGYGSMLMHTDPIKPYPIPAIGGYTVPGERFIKWKDMLKANGHDGKIYGMSKRRREQFPAIVEVVHALVKAIPRIKQVTFCSGGNREGVLYMKLPPSSVREIDPLPLLPGVTYGAQAEDAIVNTVVDRISSALPAVQPSSVFTAGVQSYIARNVWVHMGDADDANSARALHHPISGSLAGLPGLTHEIQAVLSLTMCARWGSDLGPMQKELHKNLQALIGVEVSFWCEYIGTVARVLATIIPIFPHNGLESGPYKDAVSFQASISDNLGKKSHKTGIVLQIAVAEQLRAGIDLRKLEDMFSKVGKGLHLGWTVEAHVVERC
ncbi:retrograde regulation protein 2 [Phlyctema vagabunda]|uniref:Retrograde regulation protein 2 n=1 Tax=Phlyctema vagabunda TaxID=108571 RepID=A0ABR4P742_9HELO